MRYGGQEITLTIGKVFIGALEADTWLSGDSLAQQLVIQGEPQIGPPR